MFISKRLLLFETRRLMFNFLERIYSLIVMYAIYNVLYMKVLYIYNNYHMRSIEAYDPLWHAIIIMFNLDHDHLHALNVCRNKYIKDPRTSWSFNMIMIHHSINNINNYNLTLLIYSLQDLILQLLFINIQLFVNIQA